MEWDKNAEARMAAAVLAARHHVDREGWEIALDEFDDVAQMARGFWALSEFLLMSLADERQEDPARTARGLALFFASE